MSKLIYDSIAKRKHFNIKTTRLLALGFFIIIMIGTGLLCLPISIKPGGSPDFMTALFTATSATCVTGLIVVDTYTHWTLFGQIVILCLIQTGGLGFMTVATLFSLVVRRKISYKERIAMAESISQYSVEGVVSLTRKILLTTFIIEGTGAVLLAINFIPIFGLRTGIYYGIFHSVSAFCNAGFDIMGRYGEFSNLSPFVNNIPVNIIIMLLIIIGGLGFAVINDIVTKRRFKHLHLHSKLVITISALLLLVGFVFFFFMEYNNPSTMKNLDLKGKLAASMFQSVTVRTAGFNTVDQGSLTNPSILLSIMLMAIGGSPGSTAGGIKTVTFGVILFTVISAVKGRSDTEMFKRRLPHDIVIRAFTLGIFGLFAILVTSTIVAAADKVSLAQAVFEGASAFGTVGLTLGITPQLGLVSHITLIITMFLGRVGILTTLLAIGNKSSENHQEFRYKKSTVSLG